MLSHMLEWYDLTDEERRIRDLARQVAHDEIAPNATRHDLEGTFVRDSIDALGRAGLMGLNVPKEYGGMGASPLAALMAVEAISAACGSTGASYHFHLGVATLIKGAGPEHLREKYLTAFARGALGALAINEGTQFFKDQFETLADDRGDHFVINGQKPFVTSAGEADVYIVHVQRANSQFRGPWAVIDQDFLLVDKDTPGMQIARIHDPMGIRGASNGAMKFVDVRVTKDQMMGGAPWGGMRVLTTKTGSIVGPGIVGAGLAGAALTAAARQVRERGDEEWIRHAMGQMSARLNAIRTYYYYGARMCRPEFDATGQVLMETKLLGGEDAVWICDRAMEIMGGGSFMRTSPVQRCYRDARATQYLNMPMDTRRSGAGGMVYEADAQAEKPQPMSIPWEPGAVVAHRMFSTRGMRMFPEQAEKGAFTRGDMEAFARSRGEDTMTLNAAMEYTVKSLLEFQGSSAPAMAGAGAGSGRSGGPPPGFRRGAEGPPPGFNPANGPPPGFGPTSGRPGGPPPGFRRPSEDGPKSE